MPTTPVAASLAATSLHVEETRSRTTPRHGDRDFSALLRVGADVVLGGAEAGAAWVGGPIVGAAVRTARTGIAGPGPLSATGRAAAAAGESSTFEEVRALQEQSQDFNLQFLSLQESVQQENRRFTTVSNVLKAQHETAKAAISNVRS